MCKCGHPSGMHVVGTKECWGRANTLRPSQCPCLEFHRDTHYEEIMQRVNEMIEDLPRDDEEW